MNPKYVGCGGPHLSQDCTVKQNNSEKVPKPPPKCANYSLEHPSYKSCPQFPLKPQFRKTCANVTAASKTQISLKNEILKLFELINFPSNQNHL